MRASALFLVFRSFSAIHGERLPFFLAVARAYSHLLDYLFRAASSPLRCHVRLHGGPEACEPSRCKNDISLSRRDRQLILIVRPSFHPRPHQLSYEQYRSWRDGWSDISFYCETTTAPPIRTSPSALDQSASHTAMPQSSRTSTVSMEVPFALFPHSYFRSPRLFSQFCAIIRGRELSDSEPFCRQRRALYYYSSLLPSK
jgi:hypothetical protein